MSSVCERTSNLHPSSSWELLHLTQQALGRQDVRFALASDSPYAGRPSPELNLAWRELSEKSNIRHTGRAEMQEPVVYPTTWWKWVSCMARSSSSASLRGMRSQCSGTERSLMRVAQKMLRQWTYRDHYHPDLSDGDVDHLLLHAGMFLPYNFRVLCLG